MLYRLVMAFFSNGLFSAHLTLLDRVVDVVFLFVCPSVKRVHCDKRNNRLSI